MALPATGVFEIRTSGNDSNGGGFNPSRGGGGVDRSQQDSPHVIIDGTTITATIGPGTTQTILAGYTVSSADLGNFVQFGSAVYEITAVNTGSNYWTCDRTVGSGVIDATVTGRMGGAMASPGKVAANVVAGNDVWIKSGTYSVSTSSSNVSNGVVSLTVAGSSTNAQNWIGYGSTRGDGGTKPVISAGVNSVTLFTISSAGTLTNVENIEFDGNSRTGVQLLNTQSSGSRVYRCKFIRGSNRAVSMSNGQLVLHECEVTLTTGAAAVLLNQAVAINCYCHDNSVDAIALANQGVAYGCICTNNSGNGIYADGNHAIIIGNTSYGNTSHGITANVGQTATIFNNVCVNNGGYGITGSAAKDSVWVKNNATYNNTSGGINTTNLTQATGNIALTGSPFVNAGSGNYALNSTAGAGAACKAAGAPGAFPAGLTTSYLDIGAAQHQDAGGLVNLFSTPLIQASQS